MDVNGWHLLAWAVGVASYPWVRWVFRFYRAMLLDRPDDVAFVEYVPFRWPFERPPRPIPKIKAYPLPSIPAE